MQNSETLFSWTSPPKRAGWNIHTIHLTVHVVSIVKLLQKCTVIYFLLFKYCSVRIKKMHKKAFKFYLFFESCGGKIGCHLCFNPECNTDRGFIDSCSSMTCHIFNRREFQNFAAHSYETDTLVNWIEFSQSSRIDEHIWCHHLS